MTWLWIGLGGAAGTLMRYGLSVLLAQRSLESGWPLGTLLANVLGSFGLGVVLASCEGVQIGGTDARLVLGVGVMGGFTTYSTFDLETIRLAQDGHLSLAAAYAALTVLLCLGAGFAGLLVGKSVR